MANSMSGKFKVISRNWSSSSDVAALLAEFVSDDGTIQAAAVDAIVARA